MKKSTKEYGYRGQKIDNNDWVEGDLVHVAGDTFIVCEATINSDGETADLYAIEWYKVKPETICLLATEYTELEIGNILQDVSCLNGVIAVRGEDEIGIKGGHMDDYILVGYLGQLISRGELKMEIMPERKEYITKLLESRNRRRKSKDEDIKQSDQ